MLLKSIKLDNVRSYTNQKIEFPMGSLLLSGDIGSGKSTILLGIEFALFGSKPSELPASSLLRHGKKEGSVELNFDVDGKDIIIKRILKRGKNGIKQETGYIITNGVKNELSPVEMKSHIFELLGYPKDLVSKGKDLIYRYTVYTPQEEMKRILMEEKDARLNTLRKVFNIDKYRRIKDNAAGFLRSLREKKREIEGFISDLDEKRKELGSITKEVLGLDDKIKVILPKYEKLKGSVKVNRENVNVFEKNINELNKLKNSLNVLETELRNFVNENSRNNESLEILEKQIKAVEEELGKEGFVEDKDIKEKIGKIEDEIKKINQEIDDAKQKINECVINKNKSQEIIKKISEIDECPMCLQNVKHEHKNSISERESKNIAEVEKNLETYSVKGKEFKEKLELLEKEKE